MYTIILYSAVIAVYTTSIVLPHTLQQCEHNYWFSSITPPDPVVIINMYLFVVHYVDVVLIVSYCHGTEDNLNL